MKWLFKFIDLLLYGNFWIAGAALAMSMQTEWLFRAKLTPTPLHGFIFFATLLLYAVHRLVGMQKVAAFRERGRFQIIFRYRRHITAYALIAGALSVWFFLRLPWRVQVATPVPALLSLAYVLPFLAGRRRLRDLHYVKIFMIALVWTWVSVLLPAYYWGLAGQIPVWITAAERFFFVFAITLPFDIRDLKVDAHTQVRTLPGVLGLRGARRLAILALCLMTAVAALNYYLDAYSVAVFLALLLSAGLSYVLIHRANRMTHDYYFTGLIDGMMIVQPLLIGLLSGN